MKLISYGCTNYKPFKTETILELRPLTLIFGKNSSGKSAALRLLPLLFRALAARTTAFPLRVGELNYGTSFTDLVHGRLPHGQTDFSICLEDAGERFDLQVRMQNIQQADGKSPPHSSRVKDFKLASPTPFALHWLPTPDEIPQYDGMGPIPFRGLLPDAQGKLNAAQWQTICTWREKISKFEAEVTHLGPFRALMKRFFASGEQIPLGLDGAGAPSLLAANPDLRGKVSQWYEQHLDGWQVDVFNNGLAYECRLERGHKSINMADVGEGMKQVLPVVVQQMLRQLTAGEGFIDLIEQPELHLHTAAQAPLGDLFLDSAKQGRGQVLVETHSENLLLRVRRRIAEGADPDLVALYWVGEEEDGSSTLRRIQIDNNGALDWWQEGVFSEGFEEVRALNRAVRAKTSERKD